MARKIKSSAPERLITGVAVPGAFDARVIPWETGVN